MDLRKSKTKIKHGISSRGTSDRLKQQSVNDRALKRSEMTKRFRGAGDIADTHVKLSQDALHMTVMSIKTMDESTLLQSMRTLRQFLSGDDAPIQAVVESGVIENLIQILSCNNVALIPDVLWCLSNIATGNHTQTGAVLRAVPVLLSILQGSHSALIPSSDLDLLGSISLEEDSCWTIGNIAGDSDEYRSALLEHNVLHPIIKFLEQSLISWTGACQTTEASCQPGHSANAAQYLGRAGTAVWTLSNISRGATPGILFINSGVTGPLIDLLKLDHMQSAATVKMVTEINWLFAFLTAKEDATVSALIDQGLIEVFVRVAFGSDSESMGSVPCVRILINISSGPAEWTERLLEQQALLPALLRLSDVHTAHRAVAKESLMLLCHLLEGSEGARGRLLQSPLGPALLSNIASALLSDIFEIQREAVYAMHAACLDTAVARSNVFTGAEVLSQIVRLLQVQDISVNLCCLDVLRLLAIEPDTVKALGGLGLYDILDSIQYGPGDANMRRVARLLAEDLFETDTDEEQEQLSSASPMNSAPGGLSGGIRGFGGNDQSAAHRRLAAESSTHSPDRESGVGRGSHLNRPAWMVPN